MTSPNIPMCPCGIAAADCDYHKVVPVPYREQDGEETEKFIRWNEKEKRWELVVGGDPCNVGGSSLT